MENEQGQDNWFEDQPIQEQLKEEKPKRLSIQEVDKEWLIQKYITENLNTFEISILLRCQSTEVSAKLDAFEIPRKPKGKPKKEVSAKTSFITLNSEQYQAGDRLRVKGVSEVKDLSLVEIIKIKSDNNITVRLYKNHKEIVVSLSQLEEV